MKIMWEFCNDGDDEEDAGRILEVEGNHGVPQASRLRGKKINHR
jgi:hypothetical protein